MIHLPHGAKTKVTVGSKLSEEFWVQVSERQGSMLSLVIFSTAVHVITKCAEEHLINEILHANE